MNYQGLIDFNKYTLAIAAGCFVYSIEKLLPIGAGTERCFLLLLLLLLLLSMISGILLFSAATSELHEEDTDKKGENNKLISILGLVHAFTLCAGIIILGVMLYQRIMVPAVEIPKSYCCCQKNI